MTPAETSVKDPGIPAAELEGRQRLTQIFRASLGPYEMAVRMRTHFRIGHYYWTLIPSSA